MQKHPQQYYIILVILNYKKPHKQTKTKQIKNCFAVKTKDTFLTTEDET